ncbi:MAG: hypothetical protein M3442_07805 [Chloroflexota bacterium]|nr:hypothetical protein [Chloroflexota bacterium]
MWRAFASLFITFVAIGWATLATALCFLYSAGLWRDLFGRNGALLAALTAFVFCVIGAKFLLQYADHLLEPYSGPFDERAYRAAPRDTFYADWQRYANDIVRDRRYAFYARTRQWDKLAALEVRSATFEPQSVAETRAMEVRAPRRTSMAGEVSPAEVTRAARRTSHESPRIERWAVLDEYE